MNVLLIEPSYKRKYPPLGLMKISTYHKQLGDVVEYRRASSYIDIDLKPHLIYITSLFTWDLPIVVDAINSFKHKFKDAKMRVGGVGASVMPEYIQKRTGIVPHIGVLKGIDEMVPDYSMSYETMKMNWSMMFTSRGCPHNCKYCIVKTLEPKSYSIKDWEQAICADKKEILIFDNNILCTKDKHLSNVFRVLADSGKQFDINSGFDVFRFEKRHAEMLAGLHINPIRFAFDKIPQEKALVRAVRYCRDAGISLDRIRVYVLYNYEDTIKEALYRANKVIELGCKPFVMRYRPFTDWHKEYISSRWTSKDVIDFAYYFNMPVIWHTMSYEEFKRERSEKTFDKLRPNIIKLSKDQQLLDL